MVDKTVTYVRLPARLCWTCLADADAAETALLRIGSEERTTVADAIAARRRCGRARRERFGDKGGKKANFLRVFVGPLRPSVDRSLSRFYRPPLLRPFCGPLRPFCGPLRPFCGRLLAAGAARRSQLQ